MEVVKKTSHKQSNRAIEQVEHVDYIASSDRLLLSRDFPLVPVGQLFNLNFFHRNFLLGKTLCDTGNQSKIICQSPFSLFDKENFWRFSWPAASQSNDKQVRVENHANPIVQNTNLQIDNSVTTATSLFVNSSKKLSDISSDYSSDSCVISLLDKFYVNNKCKSTSTQLGVSISNFSKLGNYIALSSINGLGSAKRLAIKKNVAQQDNNDTITENVITENRARKNTDESDKKTAPYNQISPENETLFSPSVKSRALLSQPKIIINSGQAINYRACSKKLAREDGSLKRESFQLTRHQQERSANIGGVLLSLLYSQLNQANGLHQVEVNQDESSSNNFTHNDAPVKNNEVAFDDGNESTSVILSSKRTVLRRQLITNKRSRLVSSLRASLIASNSKRLSFQRGSQIAGNNEYSPLVVVTLPATTNARTINLSLKNKAQQIANANTAMNELHGSQYTYSSANRKSGRDERESQEDSDRRLSKAMLSQLRQEFLELQQANNRDSKELVQAVHSLTEAMGQAMTQKSLSRTATMRPLNFLGPL